MQPARASCGAIAIRDHGHSGAITIREGDGPTPAPARHDQAPVQQLGFDGVVARVIPLEHVAQAAVAGGAAQGRQGSKELVVEVVVSAEVAQLAFSGVCQRGEGSMPLRMPAGLKPGQGWRELGLCRADG